jgi:hypothetical protein
MMMLVPIYFQVSAQASVTMAGAHLMPSVMGNAVGGIISGIYIKRYVFYKLFPIWPLAFQYANCLVVPDVIN